MMGGYTRFLPTDDKDNYTRSQFRDMIATLLAGYSIEKLEFGDISTGASNDIERATSLARAMVTKYGMSDRFGPIAIGGDEQMVFLGREMSTKQNFSDKMAAEVDDEIRKIIDEDLKRAIALLQKHQKQIKKIAEVLIDKETMDADEFFKLLGEDKPAKKVFKRKPAV
jgi:cell division protease FtsH